MPLQRNSQGLTLGLGVSTGTASPSISGTILRSSMLMDMIVSCQGAAAECVIDEIKVAGQNLNVSSAGAAVEMWNAQAQNEGHRSIAVPIEQNLPVQVNATLAAAALFAVGINTDPIDDEGAIVPVDQLGSALNYFGGLGTTAIAGGGTATLTTTIRRATKLGLLSMVHNGSEGDIMATSVTLNNVELLAGASAVPLEALQWDCTDIDGRVLGVDALPNAVLSIALSSNAVGALDVSGGFFCLHR